MTPKNFSLQHLTIRTKILLLLLLLALTWFYFSLPSKLFNDSTSFVIEDKNGNLLSASIAADGQWRFPYNANVPDKFIRCITTFEDKRFYNHPGIDPFAIGRAVIRNATGAGQVQGGSTLTMQVIRISRKNKSRNLWQKLVEGVQALRVECSYSKNEIMALYASNAPFGTNIVGLDAAAWRYYGRSPQQLSWGEMAALAVLPNSPSLVRPGKNNQKLLSKRNALLNALVINHTISSSEAELAKLEPLPAEPLPLPEMAPHLLQRFRKDFNTGNFTLSRLQTTIDSRLQKNVLQLIQQHHDELKGNGINNAAALVLEVETGSVLAYGGNVKSQDAEMEAYVDVIGSPRSPGSTLKPLLYAAMLSDGMILPHSIIPDIPTQISGYAPRNFDQEFDGAVPASQALSRSLNVPAVRMLQQYKYPRFYEFLKSIGITTLNRPADFYGLSLILGGSEVKMWDLAGVYASMARALNHQRENRGVLYSSDFTTPQYFKNRNSDERPGPEKKLVALDATSIWFTFQAMQEVMRPGEEGLWQQFSSSQKIAWKTGTSFGFRDGWAIGVTSKYVVAVWVGNTDGEGRPGLIGVQTAAPLMFDIFRLLPASAWFSSPSNNFIYVPVCKKSGFRANIDCPDADTVMVPANANRSALCPYHQLIHLDPTGMYRVTADCESPEQMLHQKWFVLTPGMEWYYKQKNHDYKTLPLYKPGCNPQFGGKQLELIYPTENARIYVPLEINGQKGKTVFMAAHRKASTKIFWSLDGNFLATTTNFHKVDLSPAPGKHVITLVDESGESIKCRFEILEKE